MGPKLELFVYDHDNYAKNKSIFPITATPLENIAPPIMVHLSWLGLSEGAIGYLTTKRWGGGGAIIGKTQTVYRIRFYRKSYQIYSRINIM